MDTRELTTRLGLGMQNRSSKILENYSKAQKFDYRTAEREGEAEAKNPQSQAIVQRILEKQRNRGA